MIKLYNKNEKKRKYYGWILYTEHECIRNRNYIGFYMTACQKYGMSMALGIYEPGQLSSCSSKYPRQGQAVQGFGQLKELVRQEGPVFAVNRTRDYHLALALETLGVRVYNNAQIAEIGNDKAKGYRYMEQHGIPIMPVAYDIETIPTCYPVVVKSSAGHGGTEVFLLKNASEWKHWKEKCYQKEKKYVVQQAASDLGCDLRVYVVGDQIAASVLRTSKKDFRSNFCLGGQAQIYELDEEQRRLAEQIISLFHIGMAGIDFIFHHGRMVFNEIEDMVGARMLYSLTDYNIVDAYVDHIWKDLQSNVL